MSAGELETLVSASKQGDKDAFGKIVLKLASLVTGVAYSVCGDFARSEDIGQEVFLEAWNKLDSLKDESKFTAWICKIAKHRTIDEVRHRARRPAVALTSELIESKELNPEEAMQRNQKREIVWSMLERLPETYRETMVLYYRCEQSAVEVAAALNESESTIRQRLKRGREMLRLDLAGLVSDTIRSTVPKAAFATAVMASLPATTYAAGAAVGTTTATATASKASGALGAAGTAIGGALLGSLVGLAGGFYGAWMSWKNAKYKSLQEFVVRQSLYYLAGTIIFLALSFCLTAAVNNGQIAPSTFRSCNLLLTCSGLALSMFWGLFIILGWQKIEQRAVETGEPMRKEVADALEQQSKIHAVSNELFPWHPANWFGRMLGGSAWMLPSAVVLAYHGNYLAAMISSACLIVALAATLLCWNLRSQLRALTAYYWMFALLCILTACILGTFHFLTNAPGQAALSWSPWFWLLLLLFPAVGIKFWLTQRSSNQQNRPSGSTKLN